MAQVRNLKKFDGKNRLSFVSLHDPMVETLCPDLSHDDLMKQMYLRTVAGQVYGGAAALRYLTRRLPRLWIFAPLMHIPFSLPFWQWAYAQVAKRRYKIANKNGEACDPESEGTCAVHFDKK